MGKQSFHRDFSHWSTDDVKCNARENRVLLKGASPFLNEIWLLVQLTIDAATNCKYATDQPSFSINVNVEVTNMII